MSEEEGNIQEDFPQNQEQIKGAEKPEIIAPYNPKRYPIKSYLGIITIAKREFFANLKSVRMLVLMLLFILAVVGGAYGISGLGGTTQPLPDVEVMAWVILQDYEGLGQPDDFVVLITDGEGIPREDAIVAYVRGSGTPSDVFFEGRTNENGIVQIFNISEVFEDHYFRVTYNNKATSNVRTGLAFELLPKPAYIVGQVLDMDDDNVEDDALVLVLDRDGLPIENAPVSVSADDYLASGQTNSNGIIVFRNLRTGDINPMTGKGQKSYDVEVTYSGSTSRNSFSVFQDDESVGGLFDIEGPDDAIFIVAAVFISLLGPIIAISLSFDSITKEKIQKSMDFLLSRPMGRRSIIIGKFLGILTAIALPMTVINILAVALISSVTNESPTGSFVAGFIIYTIVFVAIYILIQQIFSTLAKTTGTAILSGIAIWLIFNLFWGLISIGVAALFGYEWNSDAWFAFTNQFSIMNPSGAYPTGLGYLLPAAEGSGFSQLGLESWMPPVVMVVWLILMFFLATEIFVRKADS